MTIKCCFCKTEFPSREDEQQHVCGGKIPPFVSKLIHSGKKHDTGKIPTHSPLAYFPRAIEGVAEVCAHGEKLHGFNTWATIDNPVRRYQDADMRHELAICKGQTHDVGPNGSGLLHLKHRAWNALALLELAMREEENNVGSDEPVRWDECQK